MLCTVHILYGKNQANDPQREEEIRLIAEFLAKRTRDDSSWSRNLVLLGDFNIFSRGDFAMQALADAGFQVPPELQRVPATNTGSRKRHYDQITFAPRDRHFETTGRAGVFNFYKSVFRDNEEDLETYRTAMGPALLATSKGKPRDSKGQRRYYRTYWRTHQMSDHLPMWVELKINFGEEYLRDLAGHD